MDSKRFISNERKRADNLHKHGVDFTIVERFQFDTAVITIDGRLHVLIFTARDANDRERENYAETQEHGIDSGR